MTTSHLVRVLLVCGWLAGTTNSARAADALIRSAQDGAWSAPATWEGGKVPGAGARVQVRTGHTVVYDANSKEVVRLIHVAGTLSFATDRDTRLEVGLIKVQPGDDASEVGFSCEAHVGAPDPARPRPTLAVGSPIQPVAAGHTALIRLHAIQGMDMESCPAIVCCGGCVDFHGAPLSRTWVKLGDVAKAGAAEVTLAEPVTGWRSGDLIIVTATTRQMKVQKTFRPSLRDGGAQTEERIIKAIDGVKLTLDQPLAFDHLGTGEYRAEVANLSRNVTVESADLTQRGHTMYHRYSAGSISYAEFRHLGKEGVLGRYSLHYHLCGDTMRGSSVIGASIWDSGNRWLTIHGTNYLVVRDCVGYRSLGHGFFMEDGTEVNNILDRNLAVQAFITKELSTDYFYNLAADRSCNNATPCNDNAWKGLCGCDLPKSQRFWTNGDVACGLQRKPKRSATEVFRWWLEPLV